MKSFITLFIFSAFSVSAYGQNENININSSESSAEEIFQKCLVNMGVLNLDELTSLNVEIKGSKFMEGQSLDFNKPNNPLPFENNFLIDFKRNYVFSETKDNYLGGYLFHFRSVFTDSSCFMFEVPQTRFHGTYNLEKQEKNQLKYGLLRNCSVYILKAIAEFKQPVTYSRSATDNEYFILKTFYSPTLVYDLYINKKTYLLDRYTTNLVHPIHGMQLIQFYITSTKDHNGIIFPETRVVIAGMDTLRKEHYKVELNSRIDESLFIKPDLPASAVSSTSFEEIGKNVFIINNLYGYNNLVLNFKDYLIICEATAGSSEAIQMVKKKFPGKPIKYIFLSHYHEDHAGNLKEFMKNDIGVLTSVKNMNYVRRVLETKSPGEESHKESKNKANEFFNTKKTIVDKNLSVQFIEFGPNSHCESLVAIYIPSEKILYQADMLISDDNGQVVMPLNAINKEFHKRVLELNLEVNTIFGVHQKPIQYRSFREQILKEMSKTN